MQLQHCFEVKVCIEAEKSASFFALSVMLSHATSPKVRGFVENAKFVIGYSHLLFDFRFATKKQIELAKSPGERARDIWLASAVWRIKRKQEPHCKIWGPRKSNPDLWGEGATTLKASNDALHRCEQYCVSCDVHT